MLINLLAADRERLAYHSYLFNNEPDSYSTNLESYEIETLQTSTSSLDLYSLKTLRSFSKSFTNCSFKTDHMNSTCSDIKKLFFISDIWILVQCYKDLLIVRWRKCYFITQVMTDDKLFNITSDLI